MATSAQQVQAARLLLARRVPHRQIRRQTGISLSALAAVVRGEDPSRPTIERCPHCGAALDGPGCLKCGLDRLGLHPVVRDDPADARVCELDLHGDVLRRYEQLHAAKVAGATIEAV